MHMKMSHGLVVAGRLAPLAILLSFLAACASQESASSKFTVPRPAMRAGQIEGNVGMLLLIDKDGHVKDAKIKKTSGYPKADAAAIQQALTNWNYTPGTQCEIGAIPMWVHSEIKFHCDNADCS
jgi:TonB family protein